MSPRFEPEITNTADDFRFQATGVQDISQSLEYSWQHTGTQANVNQSSTVTGGTATLSILDGSGTPVYSADMATNGTFQTASGTPGAWTIRVALSNVDGTLNFRSQKGG